MQNAQGSKNFVEERSDFAEPDARNSLSTPTSERCSSNEHLGQKTKTPKMSLKQQVRDWLLKKVFRDPGRPKAKRALAAGSNPFAWSVLVLDSTTLRIVQSCFQVGLESN